MTANPADIMRSYIIDAETYSLAEQAGKFCEVLREQLSDLSLFEDFEFTFYSDEPYELSFIWDRGDIRSKLTFLGDKDDSTWSVTSSRKRFRGAIGNDMASSCRTFLSSMNEIMQ
ncbi:MAG: hypothetical protein E7Z70_01245 [Thermoplasmata archaeon]|jgi:hypothetical protein|nr:hypothetical protein [Thermoplasmata archaeon]MBO5547784.1 hypothetical protein [Candidatus Methanomethylophilaceae archaeon]MBR4685495.1 hypothetical protein [Candidatus Methanomethylophilaceae archaeon]WII07558.1 hypothetical protein PED39_08175 [Methanomassiliicoccales archaeon LGM-RCC1]